MLSRISTAWRRANGNVPQALWRCRFGRAEPSRSCFMEKGGYDARSRQFSYGTYIAPCFKRILACSPAGPMPRRCQTCGHDGAMDRLEEHSAIKASATCARRRSAPSAGPCSVSRRARYKEISLGEESHRLIHLNARPSMAVFTGRG